MLLAPRSEWTEVPRITRDVAGRAVDGEGPVGVAGRDGVGEHAVGPGVQVNAREAEDGNILFRLTEEDAEKVIDYLDGLNEERIPLTAKLVEQLIDQGGHDPTPAEFFEKSEEPT